MSTCSQKFKSSQVKSCDASWFQGAKPKKFKTPSIVLVYTDWCHFCRKFAPDYIRLQQQLGALDFYAMDADANQAFLQSYGEKLGIRGFPTMIKIVDGKVIQYDQETRAVPFVITWACKGGLC
jgi:thiol-disulfide isomerase/thioredoxin